MAVTNVFDALVLAGGGCRCFWQVGVLEVLRARGIVAPRYVVGVSAGSAMATMVFGGRVAAGMDAFLRATAKNAKNFYPERLLGAAPLFPHEAMYRAALFASLDAEAIATLSHGPPIDALVARPPRGLPGAGALTLGFGAYTLERHLRHGLHPSWPKTLGFSPDLIRVQDVIAEHANDPQRAAEAVQELILASSCSPPLTPLYRYRGAIALDGGLVDNVPTFAVPREHQRVLVLLTRRYPPHKLRGEGRETILQPSAPIPIKKWDYTSPTLIQETYELGLRDGESFAAR